MLTQYVQYGHWYMPVGVVDDEHEDTDDEPMFWPGCGGDCWLLFMDEVDGGDTWLSFVTIFFCSWLKFRFE